MPATTPPVPRPPDDAGPCAFGDRATVHAILAAAGWVDLGWHPHVPRLRIGGGQLPAEAAAAGLYGPAVALAPGGADPAVTAALRDAFARRTDGRGQVVLDGGCTIITGRRPA